MRIDTDAIRAFLEREHLEFAARFGDFCAAEIAPREAPKNDAEARTEARALLAELGRGGWFSPIADGDLRGVCLAREIVAAASPLGDAVYALQGLGTTPLLLDDNEEMRDAWAWKAIAGQAMAAFALTEPEAGSDAASIATTAERQGEGYVLNGRKWLISNAGIADFYVVFAQTEPQRQTKKTRGIGCFVVPADAPGLEFVAPQVLSAPHPLGEIALTDCRIPARHRLGGDEGGFKLGMATLDRLRATVGAAACGMAARALDEALAHACERRQFGQRLADFQLVQQKLAEMATELSAARLLVYRAAWEKDGGKERVTLEAAMAKSYATEAAQRIIDAAVQILGGRGVLAEHPVDHLYRAVRALRIYEGTTEIQHLVIAGQLLRRREASST